MRKFYHLIKTLYLKFRARIELIRYGKPRVLSSIETVDLILNNDLSVSRFGDGEFDIINGKPIKFQEYDKDLSDRLKKVLKNENANNLVCVPAIYSNKILKTLKYKSKIFWLDYIINNHRNYMKYINLHELYGDSCFSRPYIRYKSSSNNISEELFKKIKLLWDNKNILIVEGKYSRLGVDNDLFTNTKSIKRILCPSKNAFSKFDKIVKSIVKNYNGELILIALGPTATVLVDELLNYNIKAIDIGHLDLEYEWFNQKATDKTPIKNKNVNEISNNDNISDEITDDIYNKSILEVIE